MPGMSGMDLVHRLKAGARLTPVVLITGHGDVDMAVAAIKVGAFDFIEKPFDEARLLASIKNAIEINQQPEIDAAELEKLRSRFDTLSTRQRQVMELAVAGLSNKEIGSQLKISPKTVENHRAWVMERIGARNIADLVRIAMKVQGTPRSYARAHLLRGRESGRLRGGDAAGTTSTSAPSASRGCSARSASSGSRRSAPPTVTCWRERWASRSRAT